MIKKLKDSINENLKKRRMERYIFIKITRKNISRYSFRKRNIKTKSKTSDRSCI